MPGSTTSDELGTRFRRSSVAIGTPRAFPLGAFLPRYLEKARFPEEARGGEEGQADNARVVVGADPVEEADAGVFNAVAAGAVEGAELTDVRLGLSFLEGAHSQLLTIRVAPGLTGRLVQEHDSVHQLMGPTGEPQELLDAAIFGEGLHEQAAAGVDPHLVGAQQVPIAAGNREGVRLGSSEPQGEISGPQDRKIAVEGPLVHIWGLLNEGNAEPGQELGPVA